MEEQPARHRGPDTEGGGESALHHWVGLDSASAGPVHSFRLSLGLTVPSTSTQPHGA